MPNKSLNLSKISVNYKISIVYVYLPLILLLFIDMFSLFPPFVQGKFEQKSVSPLVIQVIRNTSKYIRPVKDLKTPTNVTFRLSLYRILAADIVNQVKMGSIFCMKWQIIINWKILGDAVVGYNCQDLTSA